MPIIEKCSKPAKTMTRIEPPFQIVELSLLRREEWIVPAPEMVEQTLGSNPHSHISGLPGSTPMNAVAAAVVTAGVLITSVDGRRIAIVTSERVPLNIEFVQEARLVSALLACHLAESVWRIDDKGYGGILRLQG